MDIDTDTGDPSRSQQAPTPNTLPLSPETSHQLLTRWHQLQATLQRNVYPGYTRTQADHELQALTSDLAKLDNQHKDCRPGSDGTTKHTDTGPCSVGTMWQPDGPAAICKLQYERLADVEAKTNQLKREIRAHELTIADQRIVRKTLLDGWRSDMQYLKTLDHDSQNVYLAQKLTSVCPRHYVRST